jgi:hypothetical protein
MVKTGDEWEIIKQSFNYKFVSRLFHVR